jgi:hypothetical protein
MNQHDLLLTDDELAAIRIGGTLGLAVGTSAPPSPCMFFSPTAVWSSSCHWARAIWSAASRWAVQPRRNPFRYN